MEIGDLFERRGEVMFGCVIGRKSGVLGGRAREGVALLVSEQVGGRVEGSDVKDYVGKNEGWVRGVGVCKCVWSKYRNRSVQFWRECEYNFVR